jgi:hypothetical protein
MKKVLLGLLMLSGVLAFAQKPKYLVFKTYKDGIVIGQRYVKIPERETIQITQIKYVPKIKKSKPQIIKQLEYKLVNVPTPPTALDTIAILQQYYPKNVHKETITLEDGVGNIQITDTISHNRLVSRKWIADVKPQIKERVVEIYRPKEVQWYMGPNITTNFTQPIQSFGISVIRKNLNDNLIQFQVGGNVHEGTMRPNAYFGIGGLLKLK